MVPSHIRLDKFHAYAYASLCHRVGRHWPAQVERPYHCGRVGAPGRFQGCNQVLLASSVYRVDARKEMSEHAMQLEKLLTWSSAAEIRTHKLPF